MFVLNKSIIKNPALAEKGRLKIEWARSFMPVMELIRTKQLCKTKLKGVRIASILHLEAKTAVFLQTLADSGTEIFATSCNPETTQDDVAAALAEHPQITVYAWRGESESDYWKNIRQVLLSKPDIIIDDGADGIIYAHEKLSGVISQLIGATEETTTGITRIKALSEHGMLRIPVIGVNEGKMKFLFDNRYGTGESSVFGLLNATNLTIAGKNAVVVGFGWVGKGIAKRLRGMGARVIICEVDPIKAVEAYMEGYRIMRLIDAVKVADFVITATGVNKVVRKEHILEAKNRCIFANSGHFNVEIDIEDLNEVKKEYSVLEIAVFNQEGVVLHTTQETDFIIPKEVYALIGSAMSFIGLNYNQTPEKAILELEDIGFLIKPIDSRRYVIVEYKKDFNTKPEDCARKVVSLYKSLN